MLYALSPREEEVRLAIGVPEVSTEDQDREDNEMTRSLAGDFADRELNKKAIFRHYRIDRWRRGGREWARCVAKAIRLRYRSKRNVNGLEIGRRASLREKAEELVGKETLEVTAK